MRIIGTLNTVLNNPDNHNMFGAWREKEWKRSHTIVVVGLIFSVFTFSFVGEKTMLPFWLLASVIVLTMIIVFLFAGARLGKEKGFLWGTGVAPVFISFLLWMNFLVRNDNRIETYHVHSHHVDYQEYPSIAEIIYQYDNLELHAFEETRRFAFTGEEMKEVRKVSYEFETGMLGIDILISKQPQ